MLRFLYSLRLFNNKFKTETETDDDDEWKLLQGAPLVYYRRSKIGRIEKILLSWGISTQIVKISVCMNSINFSKILILPLSGNTSDL